MKVKHTLDPVYDEKSEILILGTMPSVKSREIGFYYGHPQNRFWKVLADILNIPIPCSISNKRDVLLQNHIALWDVLHSCEIKGSSDATIKKPIVNNINIILKKANIKKIFVIGKVAEKFYNKYCLDKTGVEAIYLPSTSPANMATDYAKLKKEFSQILKYLSR